MAQTSATSGDFELQNGPPAGTERNVITYPDPLTDVVTEAHRESFRTKGYAVIRSLYSPQEMDRITNMVNEVEGTAVGPFHTYEQLKATGKVVTSRTENFADHHYGMSMLLRHGKIPSAVHALIGEPVALYKEKVNYKRAGGGGGYAPHQDGYMTFHRKQPDYSFLTQVCMMAIDDCMVANGCAMLGSECWQRKEGFLMDDAKQYPDMGPYVPVELKKGDMLIYDNYMPHWSTPNTTDKDRRVLFAIYNKRADGDFHTRYYEHEAENRRLQGSRPDGGKANMFFTGEAVIRPPPLLSTPATTTATLQHKEHVLSEIVALYDDKSQYGVVSQLRHGCQAAQQAIDAGADNETVVAALLHDIGWKLAKEAAWVPGTAGQTAQSLAHSLGILSFCGIKDDADGEQQRAQHDVIGATYLRMRGFSEKVAHLVEGHVLAKRYLTFKEPDYYELLSPGSRRTLVFQGGPMTPAEAAIFEAGPHFEMCKQIRRWDEGAKDPTRKVEPFAGHVERILAAITEPPCDATHAAELSARTSFIREGNVIAGIRASRL
eukprot:m.11769 g.11769  ORF g.11769 m.11769 type:complete len:546 (+) comp2872_c0_seq1:48-1685(+)